MIFAFGDCEVDEGSYELRIRGSPVTIQRKVLDLLLYLVRNRQRAVLKEELLRCVWGGVHVTGNALAQGISTLRATFVTRDVPDPIATLRGRGYRFGCSVEERMVTR